MMLDLPDVTLFCVDTVCHDLTKAALDDCLRAAKFGDVKVFSDRGLGRDAIVIPKLPTVAELTRFANYEAPRHFRTSHVLSFQWDGWIVDTAEWTSDYLKFDYIGAPWWYRDGRNVGNSGFCLRSKALIDYLATHPNEFPPGSPEDEVLCRHYRPALEAAGFKWAPEQLAHRFSFECSRPSITSRHFGFHAMRNWPFVLGANGVAKRFALANSYVLSQTEQIAHMFENIRVLAAWGLPMGYPETAPSIVPWMGTATLRERSGIVDTTEGNNGDRN